MKIKTTLSVIALTLAPSLALADGGCMYGKTQQSASQCAAGQTFDAATGSCTTATTS
jgi:hypothetical protein